MVMKYKILAAILATLLPHFVVQIKALQSLTTASGPCVIPGPYTSGQVIYFDDFNGPLNTTCWNHECTMSGCGNAEFEMYTPSSNNSYTKNGCLFITPTLTTDTYGPNSIYGRMTLPPSCCTDSSNWGCDKTGSTTNVNNPVMSGRLNTNNTMNFKYGKMEVRAKLPAGDWLWPAIWLLPQYNTYGTWPLSGEIDIVESRGNNGCTNSQNKNIGNQQTSYTLHFGRAWNQDCYQAASFSYNTNGTRLCDAFHVYALIWTPDYMNVTIDGILVGSVTIPPTFSTRCGLTGASPWQNGTKSAPFDQKFSIILNLAVGGTNGYFPDSPGCPNKPWKNFDQNVVNGTNVSPATAFYADRANWLANWNSTNSNASSFQIDYVRVSAI